MIQNTLKSLATQGVLNTEAATSLRNKIHPSVFNKPEFWSAFKKALQLDSSWGGAHFYARDDKALTMARMFLGEGIGRIDRVIKATQPKK